MTIVQIFIPGNKNTLDEALFYTPWFILIR